MVKKIAFSTEIQWAALSRLETYFTPYLLRLIKRYNNRYNVIINIFSISLRQIPPLNNSNLSCFLSARDKFMEFRARIPNILWFIREPKLRAKVDLRNQANIVRFHDGFLSLPFHPQVSRFNWKAIIAGSGRRGNKDLISSVRGSTSYNCA